MIPSQVVTVDKLLDFVMLMIISEDIAIPTDSVKENYLLCHIVEYLRGN